MLELEIIEPEILEIEIETSKILEMELTGQVPTGEPIDIELQEKEITPTKEKQIIIPDPYYDALSKVTVNEIPDEYIIPNGTIEIEFNGEYDVANYVTANVNTPVPKEEQSKSVTITENVAIMIEPDDEKVLSRVEVITNVKPKLQFKTATPTKEYQVIEADKGYDGLIFVDVLPIPDEYVIPKLQGKMASPSTKFQTITVDEGFTGMSFVDIAPVTSDIDKDIKPENIKDGIEILGVLGTLKSEGAKYAPQYISWRQQDATDLTYEVSNIDSSRIISCMRMFDTCSNLTSLDLSSWTLESCNRLGYMFYNSTKLKSINMSNFDTRKVIYMNSMFYQCKALPSVDISHFKPNSLTNVNAMFQNCIELTEVDISSICTTKINNSALMFSGCTKLTKVIIDSPNVFPMTNKNFFTNTPIEDGTGYVYVPDNLVNTYKNRTNWTTYASQIKGMSELV